ncbi:MAG: hypothetical protein ACW98K_03780 [Candidatus Kariarchaeaceae archaeon]|jgi:hypothetical protein
MKSPKYYKKSNNDWIVGISLIIRNNKSSFECINSHNEGNNVDKIANQDPVEEKDWFPIGGS